MFASLLTKIKRKPLLDKVDKPLIFIHLEKTAGTTFQSYLRSLMPSENLIAKPHYNRHKPLGESLGDGSKRLYMGHFSYRDCQAFNITGYYLTFLREPYARAFSTYSYQKNPATLTNIIGDLTPQEIAAIHTVQEMTFQEYVLSENILIYDYINNLMSRRLAMASHEKGELRLDTAFDVLSKNFYWFGLTEEFDKSIQLLNMNLFGRPHSKVGMIVEQNISPKYDNTLNEKGRQRLKELNEYDLVLYEKAKTLFYERYQKQVTQLHPINPWSVEEICFNTPYSAVGFYARGLCPLESWGTWSEGSVVTLIFSKPLPPRFKLFLRAKAFGPNAGELFVIEVGGSTVSFKLRHTVSKQHLEFNSTLQSEKIIIHIPKPTSPKELGRGQDERKLGIGLITLRIIPQV